MRPSIVASLEDADTLCDTSNISGVKEGETILAYAVISFLSRSLIGKMQWMPFIVPSAVSHGRAPPLPLAVSDNVFSAILVVESPKRIPSFPDLLAKAMMRRRRAMSMRSVFEVADGMLDIKCCKRASGPFQKGSNSTPYSKQSSSEMVVYLWAGYL